MTILTYQEGLRHIPYQRYVNAVDFPKIHNSVELEFDHVACGLDLWTSRNSLAFHVG